MEKETRELDALRQHQESIQKRMKELEKKFPRIEEECYSYRDQLRDISQYNVQDQLSSLEKEQSRLDRVVNRKVSSMFEQAEQEYQDLLRKKRIVENDRRQIQAVIKELDEKKILAVEKTWNKVNQDLASIFSSLLPGSSAYLKPLEEKSILEGLEIQVALNNSWKKNLSELSGGQRSLVALSLILALLRYKPAPLYILDEVDAALDLSHTQNIGTMLRKHFGHSQFIVVSLKEGMFQNANILFRTKLVDGVDNVGSNQLQKLRQSLRKDCEVLMGKNTMIRKALRGHLSKNPALEKLLPHLVGNVGFIFTSGDLKQIREKIAENRVPAAAKAGTFAQSRCSYSCRSNRMEPTMTSFFQALNIPTKINKGQLKSKVM
ncbi:Structural maintenance of chromosomes protein 2-1 [Galdieria sulphuraria]|nr:Structural maintenance of chromosomes protein 2-1 [Galdieria sulphuraria]